MKKLTQYALAASLILNVGNVMADTKIGYVQVDKVLQNAPQTAESGKKLEKEFSPRTAELERLQKQIQTQEAALKKDALTMSASDKSKKDRDLSEMKIDFQRRQRELSEDINIRKNEELSGLQDRINKAVTAVAEADGYDLVIYGGVAFASKKIDITDNVLKQLNAPAAK